MFTAVGGPVVADTVGWNHMDGWGHMSSWGWGGMAVFWLLVVALVVAAVWVFASRGGEGLSQRQSPLDVLETRFARGEITADEYRERREVLLQSRSRKRK